MEWTSTAFAFPRKHVAKSVHPYHRIQAFPRRHMVKDIHLS